MDKNKLQKITLALRRLPLEMALHPFLTFFAWFVAAMAVAAAFLVVFSNLIGSGLLAAQNDQQSSKKFDQKNCQNVFAEWDKRKAAAQNFLENDFNNPFSLSATSTVDQIKK